MVNPYLPRNWDKLENWCCTKAVFPCFSFPCSALLIIHDPTVLSMFSLFKTKSFLKWSLIQSYFMFLPYRLAICGCALEANSNVNSRECVRKSLIVLHLEGLGSFIDEMFLFQPFWIHAFVLFQLYIYRNPTWSSWKCVFCRAGEWWKETIVSEILLSGGQNMIERKRGFVTCT